MTDNTISVNKWRFLRRVGFALSALGILVAGYLAYSYASQSSVLCTSGGGCDIVRGSRYSSVGPISVPVLGLAGYIGIIGLLLAEERRWLSEDTTIMLLFGATLIGFLYSVYLTYLELFVIFALCPYCVASAVIMTLLFAISLVRAVHMVRSPD